MKNSRIKWIDDLRGITIILVILGHCLGTMGIGKWILSFHMPLFFIISGCVYNDKYRNYSVKKFVGKKFKGLIIPYIWFSMFSLIISFIFRLIVFKEIIDLKYPIISILLCLNIKNNKMIELVLWFLPCIFIVEIIFYLIQKNNFLAKHLKVIIFIISIISFIESKLFEHIVPFTIDIAMTAIVYFGIGYCMKNKIYNYVSYVGKSTKGRITMLLITSVISIISVYMNGKVIYMYINQYGSYIWTYIGAISGSLMILTLVINMHSIKVVSFLGKNSLLVFVIHLKVLYFINIINRKFFVINKNIIFNEILNPILDTLIIIIILIPIIKIINKHMPFLLGKSKKMQM